MVGNYCVVDREEGLLTRKDHRKCSKMSLQSRIDCEAASCWIHASHILSIMDILQSQFVPAVPVIIVNVLSNDCMRSSCSIDINFWHVHVI